MKLQFLGGAGTVTGSKTLVTIGKRRILVDCGLFQGIKALRLRNREPLPVDPRAIDSILLTHAHLDHSGYIPALVKQGFRGQIRCTAPTRELARLILLDSARLQEEDARFTDEKGFGKHAPSLPLYDQQDVETAMERFEVIREREWTTLSKDVRARFTPNGHILGSAAIELDSGDCKTVFTGDMGRSVPLLYPKADPIPSADYLVVESTYGDRTHHEQDPLEGLARVVSETLGRGGRLFIPCFAVGRAQEILLLLGRLRQASRLPAIPVHLDSPMARRATEILFDFPDWHKLSPSELEDMKRGVNIVESQQESIAAMRAEGPAIVIAGSGMISGGRILHHLAHGLGDERNCVLLAGYQAAGTRGRLLQEGIGELKMHGRYVPVRASVRTLSALSGHADQSELIQWLKGFRAPPLRTFVNHGEPQAADALRVKLRDELGWDATPVLPLEEFEL